MRYGEEKVGKHDGCVKANEIVDKTIKYRQRIPTLRAEYIRALHISRRLSGAASIGREG